MRRNDKQGTDPETLERHFGTREDLLPLWIAEPSVELAPTLTEALAERAADGWYGYQMRPEPIIQAFWDWMARRHAWDGAGLRTLVSPSVGTSTGVLINALTDPGDGVILQPPVFTDFKSLITASDRTPVRNALRRTDDGYRIDFDDLAAKASDPANRLLILCSPHNPVGRVWSHDELRQVATICAEHDVFVLADEIHADIVLPPTPFTPFAVAAAGTGVAWAAAHGPIKTFGLAGVCDTVLITDHDETAERFQTTSSQLHLTRNNVFALTAFETAYRDGEAWFDSFLDLLATNVVALDRGLPDEVDLLPVEGTYLAWLDLRRLELDVPEIPRWLASEAGIAVSPGHWFGREGAGYARVTIAVPTETIEHAAANLRTAVARR